MTTALSRANFWVQLYGACAAPVFWLGQLMLGYWLSAQACYGTDHPTVLASAAPLRSALVGFDAVAILAALSGLAASWLGWRATAPGERARFMAIWGVMSSLWFLGAIIFSTIASVTVPLCAR